MKSKPASSSVGIRIFGTNWEGQRREFSIRSFYYKYPLDPMRPEDLKKLVENGPRSGSHGMFHTSLQSMTPESAREELSTSRAAIAEWTGIVPNGSAIRMANPKARWKSGDWLRETGFSYGLTLIRAALIKSTNRFSLPRHIWRQLADPPPEAFPVALICDAGEVHHPGELNDSIRNNFSMSSLRILQIVPSLALETGGPTTSVPPWENPCCACHRVVSLYNDMAGLRKADPSFASVEQKDCYRVETFPAQQNPLFPVCPAPRIGEAVLRHSREFDIVHIFSLWNPVASFALRAWRRSGLLYCLSPLGMLDPIVIGHNRWKKIAWRLLWEGANIEKAALVQFTSAFEERRAREVCKLNRTVIIPHAVNLENWESLPDLR